MKGAPSTIGDRGGRVARSAVLQPLDMRRGHDGLFAVVRAWDLDPFSGHLYVFQSRRGNRIKILTWDHGGFVLYYKRLEQGRFRLPAIAADAKEARLDATQLAMLLDGIDMKQVKTPKRWTPPSRGKLDAIA